ncbi:MAG: glutathione-disulfide reductase [Alphaproteobacteria bacterium]|nr:glutathione-disulfide reductase [Alphaproteobacteria bacterium]
MPAHDYDLFVIGAGSGGVRASRIAAGHGAKVAIAEAWRVGGTCVLRGCVPKKLLVYGSHVAHDIEDAAGFGWTIGRATHDWPKLIANKDKELDRLHGVYLKLLSNAGVELIEGEARVVAPDAVEVNKKRVTARTILVATGGWPVIPDIPGRQLAITSNEALDLKHRPERIVIVGGGYIAVEFAGIFAALGSKVTQLYRGEMILRGFDTDVRTFLADEIRKKDIDLRLRTDATRIDSTMRGLAVTLTTGQVIDADAVMMATGRAPNTKKLGLAEVGVALKPNGAVIVDEWSRSSMPSIYAVGDVTDRINLTPVAIAEGHAFADTVFGGKPRKMDHANVPSAVFSQPSVSVVGLSEDAARAKGIALDIYRTSFRPMKHTLSGRDERMLMKLVVERATDRVLGAHMVGADAPEIIQGLAVAMKAGATKADFDATIGIHPTAAEEFVTMRTKTAEPAAKAAE